MVRGALTAHSAQFADFRAFVSLTATNMLNQVATRAHTLPLSRSPTHKPPALTR